MSAKRSNRRRNRHTSLPQAGKAVAGDVKANTSENRNTRGQPLLPGFESMADKAKESKQVRPATLEEARAFLNSSVEEIK